MWPLYGHFAVYPKRSTLDFLGSEVFAFRYFPLFWATVCKTVHPMLLDHYLSCPFLSCAVLSVCLSVTTVYCGQTVGWINMPLGREVGLGLGDIVLDGDPVPPIIPEKGGTAAPTFRPVSIVAKRLDG